MRRQVEIGPLTVGGGAPVRVESMLKVPLSDRGACLDQCRSLLEEGCELARVALPTASDAEGLAWLLPRTELPLMADIHFDPALALAAMDAGCRSIRINPGNMPLGRLDEMIRTAKDAGVVIRIGANGGSLSGRQLEEAGGDRAAALFLAVREQAELLLENGFEDIILSAKSSSVPETVRANLLIARAYPDFPLHVGLTEAGPGDSGIVKSTAGIASLLAQGVGDTLRVSLTDRPEREVRVGYEILKALHLRSRGVNLVSCPTCGRRRADVMRLVALIEPMLEDLPDGTSVAVMGCEVNGPKEAKHARLGIAGTPAGAVLFREGRVVGEYPFEELPEVLPRFFREADPNGSGEPGDDEASCGAGHRDRVPHKTADMRRHWKKGERGMPVNLKGRSFLTLMDFTPEEIAYLLSLSADLKAKKRAGIRGCALAGKNVALLFEKASTRTRCAFTVACIDEGGHPEFLGKNDIHLGGKEDVKDTARVLGRMFDGIEFRGFRQSMVEELAQWAGVPVWNGLTDVDHPTQVLADFLTLQENFGRLEGLNLTYVGDGRNNMANALMIGSSKMGVNFTIGSPRELFPDPELVERCRAVAQRSGAEIRIIDDPRRAVEGADAVYTDVWVSMGEEAEKETRVRLLTPWQVNGDLMRATGRERTIFLHCLPAVKGCEVTEEVFESPCSKVFDEAENRMHTIKAVMVATIGA